MKPELIIKHFGGVRKTAEALGMSTQCIYQWREKGYIPYPSQVIIQLATKGKYEAKK